MTRRAILSVAVASAILTSTVVRADPLWCSGTVSGVLLYSDGNLMIVPSFRSDYITLCNVQTPRNGVDPVVCLSWYGIAMSSKKDGKTVTVYYNDSSATSCPTLPTYGNSPAPGYVMGNNT